MESNDNKSNADDEVNYTELIDQGRKQVNSEDIKTGLHLINLALLSPNLDIISKVQTLAIKSFAHYKLKDRNITLGLAVKMFKFLNKQKLDLLDSAVLFCAVRMLYRGGSIMIENNFPYVGAYCYYFAKKLFECKGLRAERDSYETLEKAIKEVLKTLTDEVIIIL